MVEETRESVVHDPAQRSIWPSSGKDPLGNEYEEFVRVTQRAEMLGGCFIGRGTSISGATLYPYTRVGRYCSLARNAAIGASDHPMAGLTTNAMLPSIIGMIHYVGTELGHDVWVGANATILAGVTIGNGAVIGANALVAGDVRPYAIMIGNPAREVRRRFPDPVCDALIESNWWNLSHETVLSLPAADLSQTLRLIFDLRQETRDNEALRRRLEGRLRHWPVSTLEDSGLPGLSGG